MNKDELLKMAEEAFAKGQVNGMILACDTLLKSITEFKENIMNQLRNKDE